VSSIAQQIFTIAENNKNAIVTVETLRGKITGKILTLDGNCLRLQQESGIRDIFMVGDIKTVTEVAND
jgi:hypothetical protein